MVLLDPLYGQFGRRLCRCELVWFRCERRSFLEAHARLVAVDATDWFDPALPLLDFVQADTVFLLNRIHHA